MELIKQGFVFSNETYRTSVPLGGEYQALILITANVNHQETQPITVSVLREVGDFDFDMYVKACETKYFIMPLQYLVANEIFAITVPGYCDVEFALYCV